MLTPAKTKNFKAKDARFAIVASNYNSRFVDPMLAAARAELKRAGASQILITRVPGAYEIPVVAASIARQSRQSKDSAINGIICLGVILRGETAHAAHIGEAVSMALMHIQLQHEVPVVHEVLLLENEEQARARCLGKTHNRGLEAAQTALAMAEVMSRLSFPQGEAPDKSRSGYPGNPARSEVYKRD